MLQSGNVLLVLPVVQVDRQGGFSINLHTFELNHLTELDPLDSRQI